ncbi:hypothetical protein C3943_05405 [Lysinibacillus sp. B2A1]|nr:hypothetical protein C3943_05405 [Lysinibacillus sp. B2A1]
MSSEGFYENFDIVLSEKKINVTLYIFEDFVDEKNMEVVRYFVEKIPTMYGIGKSELLKIRDSSDLVKYFIELNLDELSDKLCKNFLC